MSTAKAPIALFFGTRPQVIKASVLRGALATGWPVVAIDTGQHYDYALHRVHYDQLNVPPPDVYLGVGSNSHAVQTAAILTACESWIAAYRPALAVVIGDTNSTLACALAAAKRRVPVAHVEAGLHATDRLMPEEINRRAVDAIADPLFAPCDRVARDLARRFAEVEVVDAGDVACDVLRLSTPRAPRPEGIAGYDPAWGCDFVYATLHRAELVDAPERLRVVMEALERLPVPCLLAAHPRTRRTLTRLGCLSGGAVHLTEPVGYLESLALARCAAAIVTDSGGLQREAYWLGVPCVTVRQETEWLETVACGANRLIPPERADLLPGAIAELVRRPGDRGQWSRNAYGDGHAAERIAQVIHRRLQESSSNS